MAEVWDEARIQQYIDNGIEESLNLDYKAAGALGKTDGKRREITKDVSAMANSDGGRIIYGLTEKGHLPGTVDAIDRQEFSKEWLDNVVSSIRPNIEGLDIHPIPVGESEKDVVYVVEIPQSHTAHQALDKRYYKRVGFKSRPMEDFEIRDVMNRLQHPKIEIEFKLQKHSGTGGQRCPPYDLEITMANTGSVFAQYVVARIELPLGIVHDPSTHGVSTHLREIKPGQVSIFRRDNALQDVVGSPNAPRQYGPKRYDPLLPTLKFKTDSIVVSGFESNMFLRRSCIKWTTYADSAPPRSDEVAISDIPIHDKSQGIC